MTAGRIAVATLAGLLVAAALAYIAAMVVFYAIQRDLLFNPPKRYTPPQELGLADVREAPFATADGDMVMVWRRDAAPGMPTILYFHGNGGSISNFDDLMEMWGEAGWGSAVMSYRGYPGSTGKPSEAAFVADGTALFDRLVADGVAPQDIVLTGYSIGTGVAVAVAAARPEARALFLSGAYAAIADIAKRRYSWLPVHTFMRDPFRAIDLIGDIRMPLFIMQGGRDRVTPLADAERLYAAANEPKELLVLPDEGHSLPQDFGFDAFRRFLAETEAEARAS